MERNCLCCGNKQSIRWSYRYDCLLCPACEAAGPTDSETFELLAGLINRKEYEAAVLSTNPCYGLVERVENCIQRASHLARRSEDVKFRLAGGRYQVLGLSLTPAKPYSRETFELAVELVRTTANAERLEAKLESWASLRPWISYSPPS